VLHTCVGTATRSDLPAANAVAVDSEQLAVNSEWVTVHYSRFTVYCPTT